MSEILKSLADLEIGAKAKIINISNECVGKKKFADVGIVKGTNVLIEAKAPFGGLMRIQIRGYSMSIHSDEAKFIYVEEVPQSEVVLKEKQKLNVALVGNPNCGKTTIFNNLTGSNQHVGNYSGVTVESKSGSFEIDNYEINLIDLPGVYSISSNSPEEEVVSSQLCSGKIDFVVNILDSTCLERGLYLSTQVAELHIPTLLVFNMADEADARGFSFDIAAFESRFNANIVRTTGTKVSCIDVITDALKYTIENKEKYGIPHLPYSNCIENTISLLVEKIEALNALKLKNVPARFLAIKLLESDAATLKIPELLPVLGFAKTQIDALVAKGFVEDEVFIPDARYKTLSAICDKAISLKETKANVFTKKLDKFLLDEKKGLPIFLAIMYIVFSFVFICADPLMGFVEDFFAYLSRSIGSLWKPWKLPVLRSLVLDGIIGGVGGVIVFLPQIVLLFLAMSFMEASGYMARAAFLMDGVMRKFGLQGKSFVPLVIGFGCTVPAIMATRTIESEKDRKTTIMVLPFMSCGARLPIYALMVPAFFALRYQALVMWLIYLFGIAVALVVAKLLKSTVYKGGNEIYLMELPPYRMPTVASVFINMWEKAWLYLKKAGTIILAISIILFILNTYPKKTSDFSQDYKFLIGQVNKDMSLKPATKQGLIAYYEGEKAQEIFEYTYSARIGKFVEPVFAPLGFDWKMSTATLGALAAKEVFVSQLGMLCSISEADEESDPLKDYLKLNYSPLQGFCVMIFSLLSIPCIATLAIIKKELGSWKYVFYSAVGLFATAWIITFIIFKLGTLLDIGTVSVGSKLMTF